MRRIDPFAQGDERVDVRIRTEQNTRVDHGIVISQDIVYNLTHDIAYRISQDIVYR